MRSVEILGAGSGEVTGSSFLVDGNILVDCGMFQGKDKEANATRNKSPRTDPRNLDAIVLSHVHNDHTGLLPHYAGFDIPTVMTQPTYDMLHYSLPNSDMLSPGLYRKGSVKEALRRDNIILAEYNTPIKINGTSITIRDAGHILGSGSVELESKGQKLVFSGDLGNNPSHIVRPTTYVKDADHIFMESTYGDRTHAEDDPVIAISESIEEIRKTGGTLLIPAFAIDRTQIILNILKELKETGRLGKITVYLDSPMAANITGVYQRHHDLLNARLQEQLNPFSFEGLTVVGRKQASEALHGTKGSKVIVSCSGMMTGGRIADHAAYYLRDNKNVILFVGYAAEGTPSRAISDGEKEVIVGGRMTEVKASVRHALCMSAHADKKQLTDWLGNIIGGQRRTRGIYLIHGNNDARKALAEHITQEFGINKVYLPNEGEIINFGANEAEVA